MDVLIEMAKTIKRGLIEKYTGKQHHRAQMNQNATHTSTDHPKGNDLKGFAIYSTQPSVSSLPPCPLLRRPFHPVIASKAKQSLNIAATDKANRSIIVSTSVITSTSVIASEAKQAQNPKVHRHPTLQPTDEKKT